MAVTGGCVIRDGVVESGVDGSGKGRVSYRESGDGSGNGRVSYRERRRWQW